MHGVSSGGPPSILAPGRAAGGPAGISARKPIASVGTGTVPYGPSNGYVNPQTNGYVGPAVGSLQRPSSWYVRVGGSNNNGGSSASLTPDRSGTDGATSAPRTFTSATGSFTQDDVGKGISISTGATCRRFKIAVVVNATTITLNVDHSMGTTSAQTWALGGAWADLRAAVGDTAVSQNTASVSSGVTAGDSVYVGAGTYRAIYAVSNSSWAPITFNGVVSIVGDVRGQYTGDAGMVQLSGYLTDDKTAPTSTTLVNFNGKANLAFSNILFTAGNAAIGCVTATTTGSQNVTFTDCAFGSPLAAAGGVSVTAAYNQHLNWLFDRCTFATGRSTTGAVLIVTVTTSTVAVDYDVNVVLRNCMIICPSNGISMANGGGGAGHGGGVRIYGCTFIFGGVQATANTSTTFPMQIYGCLFYTGNGLTSMSASTLGTIVEDYNVITATTPRTNVTAGAHSVSDGSVAQLFHWGQERVWGGLTRPFGEPTAGSPLLGWSALGDGGPDTMPAVDLYGRARPAGSSTPIPAVGALERGNTAAQGTSPAPTSGTHVWKGTGPWQQDWLLPVAAAADGFSIAVQRDSSYAYGPNGSNPTLEILANPAIGVAYQKITDTGSAGAWNTLALAAFTPTAAGWVTVRVTSYDGSGASVVAAAVATPS